MTHAKIHGLTLAVLAASSLVAGSAMAQESSLSFNAGAVTEYRYRGISQSNLKPALQAGVDYADKSGFYLGAWASSIKWLPKSNMELDLYGGYKGELAPGLGYDLGVLRYQYIDSAFANTTEVYGAVTYGVVTAKYSHATTNLFGFGVDVNKSSKGSGYLDLSATLDLGNGLSLVPHVGRQTVKNIAGASYTDYALALNKDFGQGVSGSLSYISTDAERATYTGMQGRYLGGGRLVAGLKYTF